jgi:hypothetical protein
MSETETILKNESGVKCAEGDTKGYLGLGTLILTNLRLVYINKHGKGAVALTGLTGLVGLEVAKKAGKADLDDATTFPGSFSIRLEEITRAENVRHFLNAYLRVDSQSPSLKPVYNFFFNSASSSDWANAINSAVATRSPQPSAQPTTYMPPPPPPPPPPS